MMMIFKCFVAFGFILIVRSASIYPENNIPVKVIYGEGNGEIASSIRNLHGKVPFSDRKGLKEIDEKKRSVSYKNLDAKVQLSPEELLLVEKNLKTGGQIQLGGNILKDLAVENGENVPNEENIPNEENNFEQPPEPVAPNSSSEPPKGEKDLPSATTDEILPDANYVLLIQIAQNIVSSGLNNIRENLETFASNGALSSSSPISSEQWDRLNQTITNLFVSLLERGTLKAVNVNVLDVIATEFESTTNDFVENLRNASANGTDATQQPAKPGVGQSIINFIVSGFRRITNRITNIPNESSSKNTVLSDDQTTSPQPQPFGLQEIVSRVQQIFRVTQPINSPPPNTRPTPPPPPTRPPQFGQAISNLNPFTTSSIPAGSQGDGAPTPPGGPFQQVANQVGQAINNLNPFNRPQNGGASSPVSQEDETSTTAASGNPFQNFANQVGQAINNLNPFTTTTGAPGNQGDETSTAGNPLQTFQNAANQIGEAINNLNPFRPTSAPGAENEGATNQNNPFQSIQNAANQFGQAISNLNPFNNLNQGSTPTVGFPTAVPSLESAQHAVSQASSGISNVSPTIPPSIADIGSGIVDLGNNPVEGAQNAINQAGETAGNLNPLNQGSLTPPSVESIQTILENRPTFAPPDSIQSIIDTVNKPADSLTEVVETIQSIGSPIKNSTRRYPTKTNEKAAVLEDEIMIALA